MIFPVARPVARLVARTVARPSDCGGGVVIIRAEPRPERCHRSRRATRRRRAVADRPGGRPVRPHPWPEPGSARRGWAVRTGGPRIARRARSRHTFGSARHGHHRLGMWRDLLRLGTASRRRASAALVTQRRARRGAPRRTVCGPHPRRNSIRARSARRTSGDLGDAARRRLEARRARPVGDVVGSRRPVLRRRRVRRGRVGVGTVARRIAAGRLGDRARAPRVRRHLDRRDALRWLHRVGRSGDRRRTSRLVATSRPTSCIARSTGGARRGRSGAPSPRR